MYTLPEMRLVHLQDGLPTASHHWTPIYVYIKMDSNYFCQIHFIFIHYYLFLKISFSYDQSLMYNQLRIAEDKGEAPFTIPVLKYFRHLIICTFSDGSKLTKWPTFYNMPRNLFPTWYTRIFFFNRPRLQWYCIDAPVVIQLWCIFLIYSIILIWHIPNKIYCTIGSH